MIKKIITLPLMAFTVLDLQSMKPQAKEKVEERIENSIIAYRSNKDIRKQIQYAIDESDPRPLESIIKTLTVYDPVQISKDINKVRDLRFFSHFIVRRQDNPPEKAMCNCTYEYFKYNPDGRCISIETSHNRPCRDDKYREFRLDKLFETIKTDKLLNSYEIDRICNLENLENQNQNKINSCMESVSNAKEALEKTLAWHSSKPFWLGGLGIICSALGYSLAERPTNFFLALLGIAGFSSAALCIKSAVAQADAKANLNKQNIELANQLKIQTLLSQLKHFLCLTDEAKEKALKNQDSKQ